MNRRNFMLLSALTTLIAACGGKVSSNRSPERILVIGAGIAGLAAARQLKADGHDVTILEASDRTGGRIKTSYEWPDIPVDLGASWIHGVRNNPITDLADTIGAQRAATDYGNLIRYGNNGQALSSQEDRELNRLFSELIRNVMSNAEEGQSVFQVIQSLPEWNRLSADQRQGVLHLMNVTIEHEFSGSINELSATATDDAEELSGNDVIFPDGYSAITDYLATGLDIRHEHVVERITCDEQGISVHTGTEHFTADRAVITLPIGVLKQENVTFIPDLPERKISAISSIGAGLLDKLFLRFPEIFWDREKEIIDWVSSEHGRWNEWLNIAAYTGQPVLLGFNAADYARQVESMTDEELVADAMDVLRTVYGQNIPEPVSWQRSRWGQDPFSLCSYSFNGIGADIDSRRELARPINNRLFFAGEATSPDYPSTVHGAYLSGIQAAEDIADI